MTDRTLPFDSKFQGGLLYLLTSDYDFLRNIINDFQAKYLDAGEAHIKLFKLIQMVWLKTKKPLTVNIIKNSIKALQDKGVYSDGDSFGMNNILDNGKLLAPSEQDYIKSNAYEFLKHQSMALAFAEGIDFYEKKDYDTVYSIMTKAYKKTFGIENSLGLDYINEPIHDKYNEPPRQGIWSTGFDGLNKFLEGGGFAKKECYTILSSTGRGKTAMLCNFAIAALKQGLKVLFVTLEMSEKQISQRFDAILSGFSPTELATMPEARVELSKQLATKLANCKPIIKGFDRGRLTLDGFHSYLERYCMEMGLPDVVILDWVGCLKMPSNVEKKHEALAELADGIINMSREFNCTILTAHQTNRSAVGSDIYGYDAISESFSSLFGMDVVLTLGASDKAKDAGRRVLSIAKNRFGPDSVFITLQGSKATESLNFRFREVPNEEEEAELLCPERKNAKEK
jgi:hypothetical protein